MKTCSKCNIQIDDSKKFCTKCGSPLVSGQKVDADIAVSKKQINVPASADNITRDKKPSNSKTIIGIVATAILLVTVSAIFLYMQINRNKASFASKTTEAPPRSDITSTATEEEVKNLEKVHLSYKLSADLSRVHANVYRIQSMTALGQDKQEIANLSEQQLATITADIALVKSTLDSSLTPEEKRYYQPIMDNLLEYQTMSSRVIKLASVGTGAVYMASADEKFQTLDKGLTQLNNYYKNPRR